MLLISLGRSWVLTQLPSPIIVPRNPQLLRCPMTLVQFVQQPYVFRCSPGTPKHVAQADPAGRPGVGGVRPGVDFWYSFL